MKNPFRLLPIIAWMAFAPILCASTITDPGVIILLNGGNASVSWNASIAGSAILEQSENLTDWTPISSNNTAGIFLHPVGNLTRSFYRLKIAQAPVDQNMITVQGGTLPQSSQLAGQTVSTFQIGKYEVRLDEWHSVLVWAINNGYSDLVDVGAGSAGTHPVRDVSWYDVVKWMNARSEMEGFMPAYQFGGSVYKTGQSVPTLLAEANGYRLPSEAEWEWAARGGVLSQSFVYSGSNDANEVAWTYENSNGAPVNILSGRGTWPVGQKAANELGLYDMSGNIMEWCEDVVYGSYRRARGGRWNDYAGDAALLARSLNLPDGRSADFGFRVVRNSGL
jgi:sulfatase modifying factor 1